MHHENTRWSKGTSPDARSTELCSLKILCTAHWFQGTQTRWDWPNNKSFCLNRDHKLVYRLSELFFVNDWKLPSRTYLPRVFAQELASLRSNHGAPAELIRKSTSYLHGPLSLEISISVVIHYIRKQTTFRLFRIVNSRNRIRIKERGLFDVYSEFRICMLAHPY